MCDGDPDKAECIREIEEAKASPGIDEVQEGKISVHVLDSCVNGFICDANIYCASCGVCPNALMASEKQG